MFAMLRRHLNKKTGSNSQFTTSIHVVGGHEWSYCQAHVMIVTTRQYLRTCYPRFNFDVKLRRRSIHLLELR